MPMKLVTRRSKTKVDAGKQDDIQKIMVDNQLGKILNEAQHQMSVLLAAQEKERQLALQTRIAAIEKERDDVLSALEREKEARLAAEKNTEDEKAAKITAEKERDEAVVSKAVAEKLRDEAAAGKVATEKRLNEEKEARIAAEKERDGLLSKQNEVEKGVLQLLGLKSD